MKWISEETLKDCQIFRYSKMENGKEGVRPVTVDELPGIEFDIDYSKINALKTHARVARLLRLIVLNVSFEGEVMEPNEKLYLTREEALKLHRQMWTDMQKDLGDCPNPGDRVMYKAEWCLEHGYDICNDCFLCEYDVQHNDDKKRCKCLIEWKYDVCYRHGYYTSAPISEILALPEREVSE